MSSALYRSIDRRVIRSNWIHAPEDISPRWITIGARSRSTGGDTVNSRHGIARVLRLVSTHRDSRTETESIELDHVTAGYTSRVTCRYALICMGNQVAPISYTPSITECFALGDVSPPLGRPFPRHSIATTYVQFPWSYDLILRSFYFPDI